jgi:hypothetical protein
MSCYERVVSAVWWLQLGTGATTFSSAPVRTPLRRVHACHASDKAHRLGGVQRMLLVRMSSSRPCVSTGAKNVILKVRDQLKVAVEAERERYFTTNALRNPFRDVELYVLPLGIAVVAWLAAVLVDATCSTDFCERTEDTFQNVYLFIFFCVIVLAWRHIRGAVLYAKDILLPMVMAGANGGNAGNAADVAAGILGNIAERAKQKTH